MHKLKVDILCLGRLLCVLCELLKQRVNIILLDNILQMWMSAKSRQKSVMEDAVTICLGLIAVFVQGVSHHLQIKEGV